MLRQFARPQCFRQALWDVPVNAVPTRNITNNVPVLMSKFRSLYLTPDRFQAEIARRNTREIHDDSPKAST
jgi:hypothetical protein